MTEKTVEAIKDAYYNHLNFPSNPDETQCFERVAAWHEAEIRRILEPIIKLKNNQGYNSVNSFYKGIAEALQLAELKD